MELYPNLPSEPEPMSRISCRQPPASGCVSFMRYWRFTSNRMREFGPFDRFIDRSKLTSNLTFDELVSDLRYAIAVKIPVIGTMETKRYEYEDQIFPFKGMSCPKAT